MNTIYEKTCIVCGRDFTARQYTAKTCSQQCRNILSLSRQIASNAKNLTDDIPNATPESGVTVDTINIEDKVKEHAPIFRKLFHKNNLKKAIKNLTKEPQGNTHILNKLFHKQIVKTQP